MLHFFLKKKKDVNAGKFKVSPGVSPRIPLAKESVTGVSTDGVAFIPYIHLYNAKTGALNP